MLRETTTITPEISRSELIDTRWTFGFRGRTPVTTDFRFGDSGAIEQYRHDNEATWQLNDNNALEIYQRNGKLMWTSDRILRRDDGRAYLILTSPGNTYFEFELSEYRPPLSAADFLFPGDLRVTPTRLQRILLIGSCLTSQYLEKLTQHCPGVVLDRILFNFANDLPAAPPAPVASYDFQYVQIPLRSVIGDRIVWAPRFNEPGFAEAVLRDGFNVIDVMLSGALRYNRSHGLLTLVSNFMVPQASAAPSLRGSNRPRDLPYLVHRLNDYLAEALEKYSDAYLMDVNAIAGSIGKRYVLDDVIFFYSHGALLNHLDIDPAAASRIESIPAITEFYDLKTDEFVEAIYQQMVATYRTVRQIDQVKAVVFDLDNTLWRGQVAEHYRPENSSAWPPADGWPMGMWEAIHHLRSRGILVAICSKNDRASVERNWANAMRPEFLSLSDFSSIKINWQPKAENVRAICEEFSIKPRSVVFVDDNPVERSAVKAALPDVRVIGSNPLLTRRILLWAAETQVTLVTEESARREEMIRGQIVREETRAVMSREEFLESLGSEVKFTRILAADHPDIGRVLELINKTNQFNTTGRRWTHAQLTGFLANRGVLLAFRVDDRFASYGLVGALLVDGACIEQFVMSCRILGMEIEQAAIAYAAGLIRRDLGLAISALLVPTADNAPCHAVYAQCGFVVPPQQSAGDGRLVLPPDSALRPPSHITVNE
jgi:FkbH-like protein